MTTPSISRGVQGRLPCSAAVPAAAPSAGALARNRLCSVSGSMRKTSSSDATAKRSRLDAVVLLQDRFGDHVRAPIQLPEPVGGPERFPALGLAVAVRRICRAQAVDEHPVSPLRFAARRCGGRAAKPLPPWHPIQCLLGFGMRGVRSEGARGLAPDACSEQGIFRRRSGRFCAIPNTAVAGAVAADAQRSENQGSMPDSVGSTGSSLSGPGPSP